jgi:uncharacterized protein YutE (UPF0331/DUF86 family)
MKNVISAKLERLKEEIKYLSDRKKLFLGELKTSTETKKIVERSVYLCAEIALDIGELMIVKRRYPRPSTYSDVIYKLGDYGVIPSSFAQKFVYVAGLRNFLAHDYQRSTLPELERFLKYGIKDMNTFIRHVEESITNE